MLSENDIRECLEVLGRGWDSDGSVAAEQFIAFWSRSLHVEVQDLEIGSDSLSFRHEISTIRLRGMGLLPVLLVCGDSAGAREALGRFRHGAWYGRHVPIVLCAKDSAYVAASKALPPGQGLILSPGDIVRILLADDGLEEFRREVLRQVPFQRLIPFTITRPAEGAMFFGRREELSRLIEQEHVAYAVSGKARAGKTSLLRRVRSVLRRNLHPRAGRVVEVDLYSCQASTNAAARQIAMQIAHTSYSHDLTAEALISFLRHIHATDARFSGEAPIDLMIDEVDEVFTDDKRRGYPLLGLLRQAMEHDLIRLTIFGQTAPREIAADNTNPLHGRLYGIHLGPLGLEDAHDLLLFPLAHMGVELEDRGNVLKAVLGASGIDPMRIQQWGLEIANIAAANAGHVFTNRDLVALQKKMKERIAAVCPDPSVITP